MKKILKISSYILILLALALLGYYFILKTNGNTPSGKKPFFGNLFPFGNNEVVTEAPFTGTPEIAPNTETGTFDQVVRLISNEPVAGSVFVASSTKGTVIRYIEKATGHVFDVPASENTNLRVSNTTIPQIYRALFTENGDGFIAQYVKNTDVIETMYGKIVDGINEKIVVGTILSRNITSFAVSPNGRTVFTLEKTQSGSEGYTMLPNGTNKKLVWNSPLREFIPQFISDSHVGLQSKPHTSSYGILFDVNTGNAAKSVLVGNQINLTTLPYPNKPYVLYANNSGLFSQNTSNNAVTELSPNTFPEKCVWAQTKTFLYCAVPRSQINATSLYAWYKGEVSYSDDIWEYDVVANTARRVVDLENLAGRSIDVSTISINPTDALLLIQSKSDGSLWTIKTN